MSHKGQEIFYTLQGEGFHTGRPRRLLQVCQLQPVERPRRWIAQQAICKFCDTDFVGTNGPGGGHFRDATELAVAVARAWPESGHEDRMAVMHRGEPLLQLDTARVDALHAEGFYVAVETNGTRRHRPGSTGRAWVPRSALPLVLTSGDELKLVYPQDGGDPAAVRGSGISVRSAYRRWTVRQSMKTPPPQSSTASSGPSGGSVCKPTRT